MPVTLDEFREEISEFRRLMESRSFWNHPEVVHELAIKALQHEYMHVQGSIDEVDAACAMLRSVVDEYARRSACRLLMVSTSPLVS